MLQLSRRKSELFCLTVFDAGLGFIRNGDEIDNISGKMKENIGLR
jgi:hypothetical protein